MTCLPPRIHHHAPRQVPCTVALALGHQGVSIPLQFGLEPRCSSPAKQIGRAFPTSPALEDAGPVRQTWQVKVVDVVPGDDVRVGGLDRGREALENLRFAASVLEDLPFVRAEVLHARRRTQHRFVFDAGLKVKRQQRVGHRKRFGGAHVGHLASNREVNAVATATTRLNDLGFQGRSVVASPVNHLAGKSNVHPNVAVEKESIHEGDVP